MKTFAYLLSCTLSLLSVVSNANPYRPPGSVNLKVLESVHTCTNLQESHNTNRETVDHVFASIGVLGMTTGFALASRENDPNMAFNLISTTTYPAIGAAPGIVGKLLWLAFTSDIEGLPALASELGTHSDGIQVDRLRTECLAKLKPEQCHDIIESLRKQTLEGNLCKNSVVPEI